MPTRTPFFMLFLLVFLASPTAAQEHMHGDDPDEAVEGGGTIPEGWQVRTDRGASMDNVRFMKMERGYHVVLGPAAIFYRPEMTASGAYTVHATFTQNKAPRHPEAYGLIVGGKNLDGDSQDYLYFLVRQNGEYLIKHRAGSETHTLTEWTAHEAIHKADDAGKASNVLAIRSEPDRVRFLVNGAEVAAIDRVPMLDTDGVAGFRVNHNLDVTITDFGVEK
ncbi:hypothetical protein [Rhodocaloribacter sp.]